MKSLLWIARPGQVWRLASWALTTTLLPLILTGCFLHHHKQIGASMLDDKVTTERVEASLKRSPDLQQVHVATTNGVVTLSGHVRTDAEKQKAEQLAKSVERMTKLQDEIQVQH